MNYLRTIDGTIYRITRCVLTGYLCEKLDDDEPDTLFVDEAVVDKLADTLEELKEEEK